MSFHLSKVVEVEWYDANGLSRWHDIKDYINHDVLLCKTAGYLLKRTNKAITIVLTQADNADLNQAMCIPIGWIKRYRVLRA